MKPVVYIVDDEQRIASTFAIILNREGFAATAFNDPLAALEAAKKLRPEFLLSDVQLVGMSGLDLAVRLREVCPECKVLLFTGQVDTDSLRRTIENKGYDFEVLSKPVHPPDLVKKLHSL